MGRVEGMVSENAKVLLDRAIEACLSQAPIKHQLDEVSACVQQLKAYRDEIPDEMDQLQKIANILASAEERSLSGTRIRSDRQAAYNYISMSDGVLIL